jgi:MoxR-like ATPase
MAALGGRDRRFLLFALENAMKLRTTLCDSLIERDDEVDMLLLGLLSRQHVLFVGEPGTAKSLMVDNLLKAIDGSVGFSCLMHKFLPPEETVGPLKLSELQNDRYERATEGYLPEANIAFLDEIWKASPAILNTLLKLLNERRFKNGNVDHDVPLRFCVAASNEWPIGEGFQTTGALFDRFLLRKTVRPVSAARRHDLAFGDLPEVTSVCQLADIDKLAEAATNATWSLEAQQCYLKVADELHREGIRPGDRRLRAGTRVAQAAAVLSGSTIVGPAHLEPLKYVFWTNPEQQELTHKIVGRLTNPGGAEIMEILAQCEEVIDGIEDVHTPEAFGAMKKLMASKEKLSAMNTDRSKEAVKVLTNSLKELQARMVGI